MVPGTNVLADITTGDPWSQGRFDRIWKLGISVFDGVKRQASLGVNNKWFADRIGGAGLDASDASSTKACGWSIGLKWFRCEEMANHHP
jgi:hypothetical protein